MTNREYNNKQHRGSSPTRAGATSSEGSSKERMPSEEWKDLTWYPLSTELHNGMKETAIVYRRKIKK